MQALVFDVWGDLGHFKKFYTTSSPLTYSFPPPPTIRGMLGAIMGVDKTEYLSVFNSKECHISLQILAPIKKIRFGINHINTKGNYWSPVKKGNHQARTQIRTEFVKDARYRIFVYHRNAVVYEKLKEMLAAKKTVFSLSLGLSELLASYRYRGVWELEKRTNAQAILTTVTPFNQLEPYSIALQPDRQYLKEKLPIVMQVNRQVTCYTDVLFEVNGSPIEAVCKEFWEVKCNGQHIVFM